MRIGSACDSHIVRCVRCHEWLFALVRNHAAQVAPILQCRHQLQYAQCHKTLQAFCFASMAAQAPHPSLSEDKYVALVSGLGLGDDAADPLKLPLLVDYLVGSLASNEEQTIVSKVACKQAGGISCTDTRSSCSCRFLLHACVLRRFQH